MKKINKTILTTAILTALAVRSPEIAKGTWNVLKAADEGAYQLMTTGSRKVYSKIFEKADKDRDGVLNREEKLDLMEKMNMGKGYISFEGETGEAIFDRIYGANGTQFRPTTSGTTIAGAVGVLSVSPSPEQLEKVLAAYQ